jgi:hypothetical protein
MKILSDNGNLYEVSIVPFEDKSEPDENGHYEYYYSGINISFKLENKLIQARKYDDEDVISFFKNPYDFFGEDKK